MEGAAGGGLGFLHRVLRGEVRDFGDQAGGGERFFDVVALERMSGSILWVSPLLR